MLLAQYGVYSFGGEPMYEVDMTRQFSFYDEDGEYDHMAQLACTFRYEPTDELRAVGEDSMWSDGDDFFARALAMPGFRIVDELGLTPSRLVLDYGDI